MKRLRKTLFGSIKSADGWTVSISTRTEIRYHDSLGDVFVGGEATGGPGIGFDLYTDSIQALPLARQVEIVGRIQEAFTFARWHLRVN